MMRPSTIPLLALLTALPGCGSVELPREHYWRLDLPVQAGGELPRGGVLRVADLQLGNAMPGDCLVLASGLHLEQRELQRWVAPLDRLITDAVMLGLTRSRMFTLVKGAADPGPEDRTLRGRVVEFAETLQGERAFARAVVEFWVEDQDGVVFAQEFAAERPLQGHGADAAVQALSLALQQILDELTGRMREAGMFAGGPDARPAAPGK
ncbi:MAG: ABC-type transport auxiliary lipoprotein family protein [Planctomycetota bacterium]